MTFFCFRRCLFVNLYLDCTALASMLKSEKGGSSFRRLSPAAVEELGCGQPQLKGYVDFQMNCTCDIHSDGQLMMCMKVLRLPAFYSCSSFQPLSTIPSHQLTHSLFNTSSRLTFTSICSPTLSSLGPRQHACHLSDATYLHCPRLLLLATEPLALGTLALAPI